MSTQSTLPTHMISSITRARISSSRLSLMPRRRQLPSGHALSVYVHLRTILRKHAIDVADGRYRRARSISTLVGAVTLKLPADSASACDRERVALV